MNGYGGYQIPEAPKTSEEDVVKVEEVEETCYKYKQRRYEERLAAAKAKDE